MPGKRKNAKAKKRQQQRPAPSLSASLPSPPVAKNWSVGGDMLVFGQGKAPGSMLVRGSATMQELTSSSTGGSFAATEIQLDPLDIPRLKDIAGGFLEYRFRELNLELVPFLGTATPGVAGLAATFDAKVSAPTSLESAGRFAAATLGPVSLGTRLRVPLGESEQRWYFISDGAGAASDRLVSQVKAFALSQGLAASAKFGMIRVGYGVELRGSR